MKDTLLDRMCEAFADTFYEERGTWRAMDALDQEQIRASMLRALALYEDDYAGAVASMMSRGEVAFYTTEGGNDMAVVKEKGGRIVVLPRGLP